MCLLLPSTSNLWFPKMWKILCWALRGILTEEKILISLYSGPKFHGFPTFPSGLQASLNQLMASVASCRWGPDHFAVVDVQPEVGTDRSRFRLWSPQRKGTILLRCLLNYISDVVIFQHKQSWEFFLLTLFPVRGFPSGSDCRESACNSGDLHLIPRLGRSPGGGNGNPLQYSHSSSMKQHHPNLPNISPWFTLAPPKCLLYTATRIN